MLVAALEAEVDACLAELAGERDERGRRLLVRNGHAQPFVPALEQFLGSATGLSAAAITRLTAHWTEDYTPGASGTCRVWAMCMWADGIHVNVRLEQDKLCLLVIVGVPADGSKELIALADSYRESTGSWADLLRDCKRRGMRAPVLAVGDGALGLWAALREVFPDTREQRDWVHKTANLPAALPKSAHPGAKAALAEIWGAEDKRHARAAAKRFADLYGAKFGKAVAKISGDLDVLLTFYDYPAEHWMNCAPRTRSSRRSPPCDTALA